MKLRMRNFAVLVLLAIGMSGCKGGGPTDPAAWNALAVLVVPYFTVVGDVRSSKSILVYKINAATGEPTLVSGSPFAAGLEPADAAFAPRGGFAYVVNRASGNVSAYRVDARTKAFMQLPGSPFALDYSSYGPSGIVVDPHGRHAYAVSDAGISGFAIDAASGALVRIPGSPFATRGSDGFGTASIAIDPSNSFAYVLNYFRNTISAYKIGETGALKAAGSPQDAGQNSNNPGSFNSVTIDPKGKFAFVTGSCCVYVYAVNPTTGALTPTAHLSLGEPGVFLLSGFALHPSGNFAYALDGTRIYAYSIDASTGRLKALDGPEYARSAGSNPHRLMIDPTGAFAYVLNRDPVTGAASMYGYKIDIASGKLTPLARSPFAIAASTVDPVARWFNAGQCAALSGMLWSGAHPPPVAKLDSPLVFDHVTKAAPGYFYDPKRRFALHYPRGDSGGTIRFQKAGPPPQGVPQRDLSRLQTASGIKLGTRAETVINELGAPKVVNACGEQGYVYLQSRVGEPLALEFTISNGTVTGISEDLGG